MTKCIAFLHFIEEMLLTINLFFPILNILFLFMCMVTTGTIEMLCLYFINNKREIFKFCCFGIYSQI